MRCWFGIVIVIVIVVGACKQEPRPSGGGSVRARVEAEKRAARLPVRGVRRLAGTVQDLRASADGQVLTVLVNAKKPTVEGVPQPMRVGDLWAIPTAGGAPSKVAQGVTNLPGGWLLSPDSRWIIASANWEPTQQYGALRVADTKNLAADPVLVSPRVSYAVTTEDGAQLAWVEGGVLSVGPLPSGPWRQVAGEVSTAEFSPDGRYLYFRRRYAAAGGLYQVDLSLLHPQPRRMLDQGGRVHGAPIGEAGGRQRPRHPG